MPEIEATWVKPQDAPRKHENRVQNYIAPSDPFLTSIRAFSL